MRNELSLSVVRIRCYLFVATNVVTTCVVLGVTVYTVVVLLSNSIVFIHCLYEDTGYTKHVHYTQFSDFLG